MLDPRILDPDGHSVDFSSLRDEDIDQVIRLLEGMRSWREAEQRLSLQFRRDMQLNETDMKALRFLVAAKNQESVVTPGSLAQHLGISTASTTKLLDRLSDAGHIERSRHPVDRRVLMITITDGTHEEVLKTIGRTHARRFNVAARLPPSEREVIIRFLAELSGTGQDEAAPDDSTESPEPD